MGADASKQNAGKDGKGSLRGARKGSLKDSNRSNKRFSFRGRRRSSSRRKSKSSRRGSKPKEQGKSKIVRQKKVTTGKQVKEAGLKTKGSKVANLDVNAPAAAIRGRDLQKRYIDRGTELECFSISLTQAAQGAPIKFSEQPESDFFVLSVYSAIAERLYFAGGFESSAHDKGDGAQLKPKISFGNVAQNVQVELMGYIGYLYLNPKLYHLHLTQQYSCGREFKIDNFAGQRYTEIINALKSQSSKWPDALRRLSLKTLVSAWEDKIILTLKQISDILFAFGRNLELHHKDVPHFFQSLVPDVLHNEAADVLIRHCTFEGQQMVSVKALADAVIASGCVRVTPDGYLVRNPSGLDDACLWRMVDSQNRVLSCGASAAQEVYTGPFTSAGKGAVGDHDLGYMFLLKYMESITSVRPLDTHLATTVATGSSTTIGSSLSAKTVGSIPDGAAEAGGRRDLEKLMSAINVQDHVKVQLAAIWESAILTGRPLTEEQARAVLVAIGEATQISDDVVDRAIVSLEKNKRMTGISFTALRNRIAEYRKQNGGLTLGDLEALINQEYEAEAKARLIHTGVPTVPVSSTVAAKH